MLPDTIGYLLIYLGASKLIQSNTVHFVQVKKYSLPLIVISIADVYQVQVPQGQFFSHPFGLVFFIFGVAIAIVDLIMVYHICHGIADLAEDREKIELKKTALNRWKYYLYTKVAFLTLTPVGVVYPPLLLIVFIPIIVTSLIVFFLMIGLMSKAEKLLI